MEATDFDARLARADIVITGEGRIDAQTAFGKTALGVAQRAQAAGVPCIAIGGGVEPGGDRRSRVGRCRLGTRRRASDGGRTRDGRRNSAGRAVRENGSRRLLSLELT